MGESTITILEPATERVLAEVPEPTLEEVDEAVARAKEAFPSWRALDPARRGRLLAVVADLLAERIDEIARIEARNVGKPITDALGETEMVVHTFRYYAGAPERLLGHTIPVAEGVDLTFREPLGVVAMIVPWNFPLPLASWKIAPALAAGNTVVVKPSELTPLSTLELEKIAHEAGVPDGVIRVLPGPGPTVGERMVTHPDVAKIAFTGSTAVGKRISALAAETIKRVTLELGGKSANIVFADADLERAATSAPLAVFGNAGQDCCARSRLLVQREALERFMELFEAAVREVTVGDPLDPKTQMGPLISAQHRAKVASYVTSDLSLAYQAAAPEGPGFWFPPTVVCPVENTHRVARDEIFGPVVAVIPFEDEEDAVRIANDTSYGLSGSIWTKDGARALRVARALDVGALSVNSNTSVRVTTPFGGFKQSGIGRELGPAALDYYTELKNVYLATA